MMTRDSMSGIAAVVGTVALLWIAFPGSIEIWPVIFVAFVPLVHVSMNCSWRRNLLLGLVAGTTHFSLVLYWIINVLGHYGGLPWFLSVPALVLLSLYMGVYFALFIVIAGYVLKRPGAVSLFLVPALWVGLDWLRSTLFSGFPWMDPGYALWRQPVVIQIADLFGHHGVTYIILMVNCCICLLMQRQPGGMKWRYISVVAAVVVAAGGYSAYSWQDVSSAIEGAESGRVGIVQGDIDQSLKWSPEEQAATVSTYSSLSQALFTPHGSPELLVWPETALPFFPTRNPLFDSVEQLAVENNVYIISGSPWLEVIDYERKKVEFYNSAIAISPTGSVNGKYYKTHLVPFGEYIPLQKYLFFLAPLVEAVGDFTPGVVEHPLRAGKINAGVLICFESIFPGIGRKWSQAGANLLVNLTNDAWYGRSSAPRQSMAMTVFRAVETRRSLARAANTGISAFIDPLGRVHHSSDIFVPWSGKEDVALMNRSTVFVQSGFLFGPLCFVVSIMMSVYVYYTRGKGFSA